MAPPDWAVRLARTGRGLLFFDELSSAPPAVQAALLRVVLERRVGSLQLPEHVRIVAAANPPASAADGWHLSPPLANRFVHLHWTHDPRVVARGLAGTWPAVSVPVVRPERTRRRRSPGPAGTVAGLPDRPAGPGPPPAGRRREPGRRLAVAAHLGDGAAPADVRRRVRGPAGRRWRAALIGAIGDGAGHRAR